MDGPPHFDRLSIGWPTVRALTVVAIVLAPARGPRSLAGAATISLLIINPMSEYPLWVGVYGGHGDVPPGSGHTLSSIFILAGVLLARGTAIAFERARAQRSARDDQIAGEPVTPAEV